MLKKTSFFSVLFSCFFLSSFALATNNIQDKTKQEKNNNSSITNLTISPRQIVDEVWQIIHHQFVDQNFNDVDWQLIREEYLNGSYEDSATAYVAIKEMLNLLGDPSTRFMTPDEFKSLQSNSNISGVGLNIQKDPITREIKVVSTIVDSPAHNVGILSDDIVTHIDEQEISGMNLREVVSLLQGELGTEVRLVINRDGQTINLQAEVTQKLS